VNIDKGWVYLINVYASCPHRKKRLGTGKTIIFFIVHLHPAFNHVSALLGNNSFWGSFLGLTQLFGATIAPPPTPP
jgi:hypothetical protein